MKGRMLWFIVALGIVIGLSVEVNAAIYLWMDEGGVVHMTNQWANVPESARSRVSVRDGSAASSQGTPAPGQAQRPLAPLAVKQPTLHTAPDIVPTPSPAAPVPAVVPFRPESSRLIPSHRPFVNHRRKVSPPFPYNVRLDPFDPNFVWVGPDRVPKNTFMTPRVSLDKQVEFRDRIRALEQRRAVSPRIFPAQPVRP